MSPATSPPDLESTASLLELVRRGDGDAKERLLQRYLPLLQRWARGRLPQSARDLAETDDLVQLTLIRALDAVDRFEPRGEGAFLAYLRRILLNAIRDEIRRTVRRPGHEPLDDRHPDRLPSVVERAIGRQSMERYEKALATLRERQQEALILRLELGYSHAQIADAIGCPSAGAARMVVTRALLRLAEAMED